MRKVFTFSIIGFILIAVSFLLIVDEVEDSVTILSMNKHYSRLLTESSETISIPLFFSSDNSFLTDSESIEQTYILDEFNQMEVSINQIRYVDEYTVNSNEMYHMYMFDISFNNLSIDIISFNNAFLKIIYDNQDIIEVSIGELNLRFNDIYQDPNLDVSRLYTTVKTIDNLEYVTGLVIGLNQLNNSQIEITNISLGSNYIIPDMANIKELDYPIDYDDDINDILEADYYQFGLPEQDNYVLSNELIYIPLRYTDELFMINRFPIYIEYISNQSTYELVVDDFMYISENYSYEVTYSGLQEYIYYY